MMDPNLENDMKVYKFHVNDLPAFFNIGYIPPYAADNEMFFEKWTQDKQADIMDWFAKSWHYSIYFSIAYLILIFLGSRFMRSRKPVELRIPLIIWSATLAIYSIVGSIRAVGELWNAVANHGIYYSVCYPNCFYGVPGFWALLFVLSKVYELGDTIFVVLRKQPLIFLHWYHHVTVLVYSWYSYSEHAAPGRWFCIMNYLVHALMYSYYAFRAAKIPIPKFIMMSVTVTQTSQMFVGSAVSIYAYYLKETGQFCHSSYGNIQWALIMYSTYFVLFINYFYQTYFKKALQNRKSNVKNNQNGKKEANGHAPNGRVSANGVNGFSKDDKTKKHV